MAKIAVITNHYRATTFRYSAAEFNIQDRTIVGYDSSWDKKLVFKYTLMDHESVSIQDPTPDDILYDKIGDLDEESFTKLRNFMETTGLL